MPAIKTPGVYIVEKNAFPNSVVEVATAIPAFVGYTEKAENQGKSLHMKPFRLSSMVEFETCFGFAPTPVFTIEESADEDIESGFSSGGKNYFLKQVSGKYLLYSSLKLFFSNGGSHCYILSVGEYENPDSFDVNKLVVGIETLAKEQEPTMVVVPDAVRLSFQDAISLQQASLHHCGGVMRNRISILDIHSGYKDRNDGDPVTKFRDLLDSDHLDFGTAYYPWLETTIVRDSDISYENFDQNGKEALQTIIKAEVAISDDDPTDSKLLELSEEIANLVKEDADWIREATPTTAAITAEDVPNRKRELHENLLVNSVLYAAIMKEMKTRLNLLPPSAAIAGVYTMVDSSYGVWKAPAKVSLNAVVRPAVSVTQADQEALNVTPQGKSVNAIGSSIGEGTQVWGARTLDGNSLDWRYVSVRRTMIMLEESIRLATQAYVFENNEVNTWITIKTMIRNFLTGIWKRGGLAGATPDDAFSVQLGLDETMTSEDILEGVLRVSVFVALIRPAEFIEITFEQQMQKPR
jgi:phage tail sheath protein FI